MAARPCMLQPASEGAMWHSCCCSRSRRAWWPLQTRLVEVQMYASESHVPLRARPDTVHATAGQPCTLKHRLLYTGTTSPLLWLTPLVVACCLLVTAGRQHCSAPGCQEPAVQPGHPAGHGPGIHPGRRQPRSIGCGEWLHVSSTGITAQLWPDDAPVWLLLAHPGNKGCNQKRQHL